MRWPFMLKKNHDLIVAGLSKRIADLETRKASNDRWLIDIADRHPELKGEFYGAVVFNREVASRYTDEQMRAMDRDEYAELRKSLLPPSFH